jgi:hypothetical protein
MRPAVSMEIMLKIRVFKRYDDVNGRVLFNVSKDLSSFIFSVIRLLDPED